MYINFVNLCSQNVIVNIHSGECIKIPQKHTVRLQYKNSDEIKISVRCEKSSYVKKSKYNFVIKTTYIFQNEYDDIILEITREKVRVENYIYYDRLFLATDKYTLLPESYAVCEQEVLKKYFRNSQMLDAFILAPIFTGTKLFFALLLFGIVFTRYFGWKFAMFYFPISYLFVVIIGLVSEKFADLFFKKAFNGVDDKAEFYNFFENNFIKEYYSNPNRTPYHGEIEIN